MLTYLCLPLWSTEPAESLSRGEPKPEKLLFFFVSITSFSRETSSSRSMSFAARSVADFSSLAVGGDCTSLTPESKTYWASKVIPFIKKKKPQVRAIICPWLLLSLADMPVRKLDLLWSYHSERKTVGTKTHRGRYNHRKLKENQAKHKHTFTKIPRLPLKFSTLTGHSFRFFSSLHLSLSLP